MTRPTVHDIAKVAGVSLATVDRVLNGRAGVRAATVDRVQSAIDAIGYVRDVAAANLARGRTYSLIFVLPDGDSAFLRLLQAEIADAAERAQVDRARIGLVRVPAYDGYAFARALDALADVDGVAMMAPETPQVRDAVHRLRQRGVAVSTLVSDLPLSGRDHFVGIENAAAGRTAGTLMGRFLGGRRGKVLVLTGSMLARDNAERRFGFDQVMQAQFPALEVLPSVEGRDDAQRLAALLPDVLRRHGDLCGIYSLGAGNRGLIDVLRGRDPALQRLTVVAHELTPHSRAALESGLFDAVISQDVGHMIRSAVRVLRAKADGSAIVAAQERIRIEIYLRENLP